MCNIWVAQCKIYSYFHYEFFDSQVTQTCFLIFKHTILVTILLLVSNMVREHALSYFNLSSTCFQYGIWSVFSGVVCVLEFSVCINAVAGMVFTRPIRVVCQLCWSDLLYPCRLFCLLVHSVPEIGVLTSAMVEFSHLFSCNCFVDFFSYICFTYFDVIMRCMHT